MRLRRFLALLRPHAPSLVGSALLLVATASIPALVVAVVHRAVDALGRGDDVTRLVWGLVGLSAIHGGALLVRTRLTKRVAWDVAADLRREVHAAWLHGAPDGRLGDRLARLGDEIDQVQYGVSAIVTAVRNPLTLIGLGLVATWIAPGAAGLGLAVLGGVLGVTALGGALVRRWTSAQRAARAAWSALAADQLRALEVIQALGAEDAEARRFASATSVDRDARLRLDVGRTVPRVAVQVGGAAAVAAIVASQGAGAGAGDAAALVAALALSLRPLAGLAEVWALLQRSLAALERVDEALATPPRVDEPARPRALPAGSLTLRWEAVGWAAGGRRILDDVTVEARPGEILAVIGPTGAGKTSLLRLAWRGADPSTGRVTLGGVDLRELAVEERRRAVALVPQDVVLWGRSVRENLTMGLGDVDDARLVAGLRAAGADFALARPGGLDGVLEEGARGLSGGERQRLCIARAWVRDARVWLLDEPTSQVDAATTDALGRALRGAAPGRTIVVVAHDPRLVAVADRVVRIVEGRCTAS